MSHVIWKHVLTGVMPTPILLKKDAIIRHVGMDPAGKGIAIWTEQKLDSSARLSVREPAALNEAVSDAERRIFMVFGTGHDIPDRAEYVGSTIERGEFVWHVYEVTEVAR